MALQSSGAISLDDIHDEAGGTSGSNCSINDADIRGLISASDGATTSFDDWYGASSFTPRIVWYGGLSSSTQNIMEFVNPTSTGNTTDFGDMNVAMMYTMNGMASSTRGVMGPGQSAAAGYQNAIEFITFASTGNGTDFGNSSSANNAAAFSNVTRGVYGLAGGQSTSIDYITIASAGNASDFGDNTLGAAASGGGGNFAGGVSSTTRGLFSGGAANANAAGWPNTGIDTGIVYLTIGSTGNTSDFGELVQEKQHHSGCSSNSRGVWGRATGSEDGATGNKAFDYVTIASTGNATDFGDAASLDHGNANYYCGSASQNSGRGLWAGGASTTNEIIYITIASTGNTTDFGNLSGNRSGVGGISNCHGGIAA